MNVYVKVDGQLRRYDVDTNDDIEARQAVREVINQELTMETVLSPILALVEGGKS